LQLDEFIENALVQIASGVLNANVRLTGSNDLTGNVPFIMQRGCDSGESTGVSFDVAVITKTSTQAEAGGKFRIFVVDAAVDGKLKYERENISRIKFKVGVDKRLGYEFNGLKK
jgi:hypothetical protein